MRTKSIFSWVFMLSSCALLAIGRIYDERLLILDINFSVIISVIYFLTIIPILFSIKKIVINKTKFFVYIFYLFCLIITPILWIFFGINDYGIEKYINFLLIIVPISIIIIEKYTLKDVRYTLLILVGVSCFLALLALFGLALSDRLDGRMATLGGGPIVFARWMGLGIIVLFFMPLDINKIYRYILITILLILALAAGSRGPILSLVLTSLLFIALNFNRVIIRLTVVFFLITSIILVSGTGDKISDIGGFDRVFMNVLKKGGSKKSTSTRMELTLGSFILLKNYPLGVGLGNWQVAANEIRPNHLMPLEYPHNLFLEVACEHGTHTLLVMLLLFLYVFHLSYNKMLKYRANSTSLYPLLFYLLIFFFLNSLVSGMINDSRILFVIISMILIKTPLVIKERDNPSFLL